MTDATVMHPEHPGPVLMLPGLRDELRAPDNPVKDMTHLTEMLRACRDHLSGVCLSLELFTTLQQRDTLCNFLVTLTGSLPYVLVGHLDRADTPKMIDVLNYLASNKVPLPFAVLVPSIEWAVGTNRAKYAIPRLRKAIAAVQAAAEEKAGATPAIIGYSPDESDDFLGRQLFLTIWAHYATTAGMDGLMLTCAEQMQHDSARKRGDHLWVQELTGRPVDPSDLATLAEQCKTPPMVVVQADWTDRKETAARLAVMKQTLGKAPTAA